MPKLIRFLARHAAFGFIIAVITVSLMMMSDFAQLRTLIMASDIGWLALFMLTFFLGLTLASVQMGIAIVLLDERHGDPGRPQRGRVLPADILAKPVPVAAPRADRLRRPV